MKNLITSLALMVMTLGFSQSKITSNKNDVKVENVNMVIEVDSAEELEIAFKIEDAQEILEMSTPDSDISLKIVCNGKTMSNGVKSSMSYKVTGNKSDSDTFIERVEKIRLSAINYYNNKG